TLGLPHPAIPLPRDLYGPTRTNSRGIDLASETQLRRLADAFRAGASAKLQALPLLATDVAPGELHPVLNPALRTDTVGCSRSATDEEVELALRSAVEGAPTWAATAPAERARILEAAADRLEADMPRLMAILIREGGKTASNAAAEVREAVDFLRYYGRQVREHFDNDGHVPLGPVACISPWNFPLAIFMGQVTAALAAGNVVLAKPAEQTPLIAAEGVRALWAAGVPRSALQLLPGPGSVVGARLVADARVQGVLFTGSTEVARTLQGVIAGRVDASGRAIPLVAETGGQNAMIVDSSALPEQVVADVLASAFDSAGQRCSALRVLCVQDDAADRILEMLLGAMAELRVGSPDRLSTDVGPVIDDDAKAALDRHIDAMRARGRRVHQVARRSEHPLQAGTFVLPTLIEIEGISVLEREVFGPVLHVVRYKRDELDSLVAQINGTGYGLTMGLHTRIDETIARVTSAAHAGNVYVNRNMVGAVVGVQPFGGEGLSGTGPKAGGPLYLYRLLSRRPDDVLARVLPVASQDAPPSSATGPLAALMAWAEPQRERAALASACKRMARLAHTASSAVLPGPTGERNIYSIVARTAVLCLAGNDDDRLVQLAAVLAVGSRAIWPADARTLLERLPPAVQAHVALAGDWQAPGVAFDAVLLHGSIEELTEVQQVLSRRDGAVIGVERLAPGETAVPLERLVVERALSINTAAAGGNASLMTID
ncbi:MAG: L-glutamate gamma-semialdehyde dehydrogenase, partial [Comamonadaceae bacterium]